jgi:hypothetical protein
MQLEARLSEPLQSVHSEKLTQMGGQVAEKATFGHNKYISTASKCDSEIERGN